MKTKTSFYYLLVLVSTLAVYACIPRTPVIEVTENISSNTTWKAGVIYLVKQWISVNAGLTIEPGAIIKFESGVYINVEDGIILAKGTEEKPITFTSAKDDSFGGDTNKDGKSTSPAAGDWDNIEIGGTNNASVFEFCKFYYGGQDSETLKLGGTSKVTVSNCLFAHNKGGGDTISYFYGVLNAYYAGPETKITNNIFYDNEVPLLINGSFDIEDSNMFHNPDNPAEINKYNGIFFDGYTYIEGQRTWTAREVPFVIYSYDLKIREGGSLTLGDTVILKFSEVGIDTEQPLKAQGKDTNSRIIFTSYRDDAHGGDTNGDGNSTSPAAGDWSNIDIGGTNNASVFEFCAFYYGGQDSDTLTLGGTSKVTVSNCLFAHNKGGGDTINYFYGVLNAYYAGPETKITNNIFYDNEVPLLINGSFDIDDSNIFHNPDNPAEINKYNGIFFDGYTYIEGQRTWSAREVPFVIYSYDLKIKEGSSFTLGDNVILKFSEVGLNYQGTDLKNYNGPDVMFTSYKDDVHGGDTNGDGNITSPADGDWRGIYNDVTNIYETWSNILYAESH